MLEIKITVTKMKNAFDRRISRLDTAKERIDESQNMSIEAFQFEMQTRKTLSLVFNIVLEVLATAIRQEKERNTDWKIRNKTLTVCRWHDPLHRKPERRHQKITKAKQ